MTQVHPERSPDESIHDNSAPVQQTRIFISERGAMILAVALSMGLAAWAVARVDGLREHVDRQGVQLRDHMEEMHKLTQIEVDRYKDEFVKLDRQYRMTELKLDDWTVVAHRAGLELPGDYARGPQGNLDAESFRNPKRK